MPSPDAPSPEASRARRPRRVKTLALALATLLVGGVIAAPAAAADDIRDGEYWLQDYGIRQAWKESKGEGVTVAIIDSGVDGSHPDLVGQVVGGTDVSGAGAPNGQTGIGAVPEHATLVATLLAGHGHPDPESKKDNNDKNDKNDKKDDGKKDDGNSDDGAKDGGVSGPAGMIGVAPKADLLSISAWLGSVNPAGISVEQQIPRAVRWAVDHGADVINMSLGSTSTSWPQSWDDAFLYAEQHDVVIVAAAGNRGGGMVQVGAPATIPGVLTVAGTDEEGHASWDSSSQGIRIGVAAPAENLRGGLPGGGYAKWSGSSGAAPIVAGVAALIRSKWPDMSANQVINRIITTADDAGEPGHDPIYGYGLLDADAALTADVPTVTENPLGTIAHWIHIHRRGQSPDSQAPSPAPTHRDRPPVPVPSAPTAQAPTPPSGDWAATVVIGSSVLVLVVVIGGLTHLWWARRRTAAGEEAGSDDRSS